MKKHLYYIMLSSLSIAACQTESTSNTDQTEASTSAQAESKAYPEYFKEVIQAHGGLEQWNKFGAMQFELTSNGNTETHIIDLKNRKDLVKAKDYTIGYNGEQVWISPDKAAFPGQSARFYHNLYFYFYAIPFVLADPGVNLEQMDDMTLQDKNYKVIGVSFGDGVGDSPQDKYKMLIDPETNRMEWLLYTVTYFGDQQNDKFNSLKYEEYQEHQGLLFPQKLTGYKYENGEIGDMRYSVTIKNLELKEGQPDQQQFEIPQSAEVDSLTN